MHKLNTIKLKKIGENTNKSYTEWVQYLYKELNKLKLNKMEKETETKLTAYETDYLLDMIIQEIEDYDECIGTLHKETLQSIYNKLIKIK